MVFLRDQSGAWKQQAVLRADDGIAYAELGRNVSLSGNIAACGVYKDQPNGTLSGSAYLFAVGPDENGNGLMDPCECPGDINKDWIVDQQDLGALLAAYGTCEGDPGYNPKANLAPDPAPLCPPGVEGIDQADLGVLLANYGMICP